MTEHRSQNKQVNSVFVGAAGECVPGIIQAELQCKFADGFNMRSIQCKCFAFVVNIILRKKIFTSEFIRDIAQNILRPPR
jgi:hypothetical protein